ncbi:HV03 protein, partial [Penelope pileata]|nr:HV03 protein [Penelope pileata]
QPRVVGAGGGRRAPGDSVLLSCQGFGFTLMNHHFWWYRQAPNGSLGCISYISYDSSRIYYLLGVKGRATASRNNSRSVASLHLRALHPEDSGHYFCVVHTATGNPTKLEQK